MLLALPEILLLALSLLVLMIDLFFERKVWVSLWVSLIGLSGILFVLLTQNTELPVSEFNGHFQFDSIALFLKKIVVVFAIITMLYSYRAINNSDMLRGEFFVILLLAVLGMMVIISAGSLITAYLGLELSSLSLYGLVAWNKKSTQSTEASVKYFILGSIASAFLLYGMSLIYGSSGSLMISEISQAIIDSQSTNLVLFGLVFLVIGVAFKLGVVPFHMWLPDVYQGAPTVVTMVLASIVKIAMFALLIRLWIESLGDVSVKIQEMILILAIASIVMGNIVAIAQKNIKRLLAYSSIAHMGFVLLGVLTLTEEGLASALYYVVVYSLSSLATFALILYLSKGDDSKINNISDLKGLATEKPLFAFLILIVMFSMAGIPPTVGFYAKFSIIHSLINVEMHYVAVVAVIMSVVGSFYYLRIIKLMYFDRIEIEDTSVIDSQKSIYDYIVLGVLIVNVFLLIFLGLFPNTLLSLSFQALSIY